MTDESVMAASERLMELLDQRDRQEEERERDDRLCEYCGGGRGVIAGPDEFGNYDPCDHCEDR